MEEYEKHIEDTHQDRAGHAWCGEPLAGTWAFTDVDHAAMNGRNDERLMPCPNCLRAVLLALVHGNTRHLCEVADSIDASGK